MSSSKTLILVRHAHRNVDDPAKDNGLSDKGVEQVKKLIKFARFRLEGASPIILTSPKKRCQETIGPVAKDLGLKVMIDERLGEHRPGESPALYSARMDEFLHFWKYDGPETMIVCSHGDWIPISVQKLTGAKIEIKKAGWCEIEYRNGESALNWLVQKYY